MYVCNVTRVDADTRLQMVHFRRGALLQLEIFFSRTD